MAVSHAVTVSHLAVLDETGVIVSVNEAWEAFGDRNGSPEGYTAVGKNYVTVSAQADDENGDRVATELRRLLAGKQTDFTVVYPCHSPKQERWFRLYATVVSIDTDQYYFVVHQPMDDDSSSSGDPSSEGVDAPTTSVDGPERGRLVTYRLSPGQSATEGLLLAFDSIGIDPRSQDTTLKDWTDPDAINALGTGTSDFRITFPVWDYPVSLTQQKVTIYTPDSSSP